MASRGEKEQKMYPDQITLDNLRKWYDMLPVEFLSAIPHHCNYEVTQDRHAINIGSRQSTLPFMTLNDHIALLDLTTMCYVELHSTDVDILSGDVQNLLFTCNPVIIEMPIPDYYDEFNNFYVG